MSGIWRLHGLFIIAACVTDQHAFAFDQSQTVQQIIGWGNNLGGQINAPPGTFSIVAAGGISGAGIRSDGSLASWGSIGNVLNGEPGQYIAIAVGGQHVVAIRSDGTLAGWGNNTSGQIDVPLGTFTAVAAGDFHSLAIRTDGTLVGWGNNADGEIDVPTGSFIAITGGGSHSVGIRAGGTLVAWGDNTYGQLNVPSGTFKAVSAGDTHNVAIRTDNTLVAWGSNSNGESTAPSGTFIAVAAGGNFSVAIRSDGTLIAWGDNRFGTTNVPAGRFSVVAAGEAHGLGLLQMGSCCDTNGGDQGCTENVLSTDCVGLDKVFRTQSCESVACECEPLCYVSDGAVAGAPISRVCGDDGCGGSCGTCDDGVGCTDDVCGPTGQCIFTPVNSRCDDGLFCNGAETCRLNGCIAGTSPCANNETCDEITNACVPIFTPIPTVSAWGLTVVALALAAIAKVMFRRRGVHQPAP